MERIYRDQAARVGVTITAALATALLIAGVQFNDEPVWLLLGIPVVWWWAWRVRGRAHIVVSDDAVTVADYRMRQRSLPMSEIQAVEEQWSWFAMRSVIGVRLRTGAFVQLTPGLRVFRQRSFHQAAAADIAERLRGGPPAAR